MGSSVFWLIYVLRQFALYKIEKGASTQTLLDVHARAEIKLALHQCVLPTRHRKRCILVRLAWTAFLMLESNVDESVIIIVSVLEIIVLDSESDIECM